MMPVGPSSFSFFVVILFWPFGRGLLFVCRGYLGIPWLLLLPLVGFFFLIFLSNRPFELSGASQQGSPPCALGL
jgi:hypothetical protein